MASAINNLSALAQKRAEAPRGWAASALTTGGRLGGILWLAARIAQATPKLNQRDRYLAASGGTCCPKEWCLRSDHRPNVQVPVATLKIILTNSQANGGHCQSPLRRSGLHSDHW